MEEIELIEKRGFREKHFLQKDGSIIAKVYDTDVHFLKNGKYEEIDNTLVEDSNNNLVNIRNNYKIKFRKNCKKSLMKIERDNYYLDIKLKGSHSIDLNEPYQNSKIVSAVLYNNVLDDVSIEYKTLSDKIKETIILKNNRYNKFVFDIDTNLNLSIDNSKIVAKNENNEIIYVIEEPYMEDSDGVISHNVYYKLIELIDDYEIELVLDNDWLNDSNRKYPVYIDPTITNYQNTNSVADTYICNMDNSPKGSEPVLKAGVERINGIDRVNRSLLKFDLPKIGTGSEIVNAEITLISTINTNDVSEDEPLVELHRITTDWDENTATWNNMNDKFDPRIEALYPYNRSMLSGNTIVASMVGFVITDLVKKWYRDLPNYGVMIKSVEEKYVGSDFPEFFSKNNQVNGNPKPILSITYLNQNGLENYLDYREQKFSIGSTYTNTFNGNMVGVFDVGKTIGGNHPINLSLIYNTNDVVLGKNVGFGNGFMLNLNQTISKVNIDNNEYLEYVDEDGTIHYFSKKAFIDDDNNKEEYYDEDGLGLTISLEENKYVMIDKNNNKMIFTNTNDLYYLTEECDNDNNKIFIEYNSDNKIKKVKNSDNSEIIIDYLDSKITISSPFENVELIFDDNKIQKIKKLVGDTDFAYNENNLIYSITDVTGIKINYDYYSEEPYRIKKVTQYGLNNTEGQYFSLVYGNKATTITDNKGNNTTLLFNDNGNLISMNSLGKDNNIKEAYSLTKSYGYGYDGLDQNKIIESSIPIKYIKNYLKNTSFESTTDYFKCDNDDTEMITESITSETAHTGNRSLKIVAQHPGQSVYQKINVPKGYNYTFSFYYKSTDPINVSLSYVDGNGKFICESEEISYSNEFTREDITIYYEQNATTDLKISIESVSACTIYIDDIQLEEGEVANAYNIIENSDFSDGYGDWNATVDSNDDTESNLNLSDFFSIVNVGNTDNTALKIAMNPLYTTTIKRTFPISGKKGDLYTLSFWYKNEGVAGTRPHAGNKVSLSFYPSEACMPEIELNLDSDKWQFFSYRGRALDDFDSILLSFFQYLNANDFYITNISFYRDVTSGDYSYDENGNLICLEDHLKNASNFKYDSSNNLTTALMSSGKKLKYEYVKNKNDKILGSTSNSGICNQLEYDDNGNVVKNKVSKKYNDVLDEEPVRLRNSGTYKYVKSRYRDIVVEEDPCSNTIWKLKKVNDYYKIVYNTLPNYTISHNEDNIRLSGLDENNLFRLSKNENGSYHIFVIDSEGNDTNKCLKVEDNKLIITTPKNDDTSFDIYIELVNDLFIENDVTYTTNGKFINKMIESDLSETKYDFDENNGLLNYQIDANGNKTEYSYNSKNQIESISVGDKKINYIYNDSNLLNKIDTGNCQYNILYDDFMNFKEIKIGNDILLMKKEYEKNNGNLIKNIYGNDDIIYFDYDNFDRISSIKKQDDDYYYYYDNNGNISKIKSNNSNEKLLYDKANRVYKHVYNDLITNYKYDDDNNLTDKIYKINNLEITMNNNYNKENNIISSIFGDNEISYTYDLLERKEKITINNKFNIKYNYINLGNRATFIVDSVDIGNDNYKFLYDNMKNITQVLLNNKIVKKYDYNIYNELISEYDYNNGVREEYNYDLFGNILSNKIEDLSTGEIKEINNYEYANSNWKDQVTKYNDLEITYDNMGNIVKLGNNVNLEWKNGSELFKYFDASSNVSMSYKYNSKGIRVYKKSNSVETYYYLEDDKIICEKRNNSYIYYLRNEMGLIGFIYNGKTYLYIKNSFNDIIGIMDTECNEIVKYSYDSWGKIININDLTDENIGKINPFRYRSYYYDDETELYYLNSRYYSPMLHRFISPDSCLGSTGDHNGYNLYAYVANNPINYFDPNGNSLKSIKKAIKKGLKKIVNSAKKIINSVKKIVKQITTGKANFVVEYQIGLGMETESHGMNVGFNKSFGHGYSSKRKEYDFTSNSIGVTAEKFGAEYGLSAELINYQSGVNPMIMPWEVWNDEETEKSIVLGSTRKEFIGSSKSLPDNTLFIGIDYSKYLYAGGGIRIGWELET